MTKEEKTLMDKLIDMMRETQSFITSNEDWPYYFFSIDPNSNPLLRQVIEDYPEDWKDRVDLKLKYVSTCNAIIDIVIDQDGEDDVRLSRTIYLPNFTEAVERNKKLFCGEIKKLQIEELKSQIAYFKEQLADTEQKLTELENS